MDLRIEIICEKTPPAFLIPSLPFPISRGKLEEDLRVGFGIAFWDSRLQIRCSQLQWSMDAPVALFGVDVPPDTGALSAEQCDNWALFKIRSLGSWGRE